MIISFFSMSQLPSDLLLSVYLSIQRANQSSENEYILGASIDNEEEAFIVYFDNINFDDLDEDMRINILNITIDYTFQDGNN